MHGRTYAATGLAAIATLAIACGRTSPTPVSPTTSKSSTEQAAAADGSTLKVSAPTPVSPTNDEVGSVGGRAGSETLPGAIIRNLWVSSAPRPNFPGDTP